MKACCNLREKKSTLGLRFETPAVELLTSLPKPYFNTSGKPERCDTKIPFVLPNSPSYYSEEWTTNTSLFNGRFAQCYFLLTVQNLSNTTWMNPLNMVPRCLIVRQKEHETLSHVANRSDILCNVWFVTKWRGSPGKRNLPSSETRWNLNLQLLDCVWTPHTSSRLSGCDWEPRWVA